MVSGDDEEMVEKMAEFSRLLDEIAELEAKVSLVEEVRAAAVRRWYDRAYGMTR